MNEDHEGPRAPQDQGARDAAIFERARNVVVDAGAGTGKTTLIVNRLLNLVAPRDDGPAIPLSRIAAVTFTRRAAGDLCLKVRTALLTRRASGGLSDLQRVRVEQAIGELDGAAIGTIHSFCDLLLRQVPMEARVGPAYEVMEDDELLIGETFQRLLRPGLRENLASSGVDLELSDEAEETFRVYRAGGLLVETEDRSTHSVIGLDAFVHDAILHRDRPPPVVDRAEPDLENFREEVRGLLALLPEMTVDAPGVRWWQNQGRALEPLLQETDLATILRAVMSLTKKPQATTTKKNTFGGDTVAWLAWKRDQRQTRIAKPILFALAQRLIKALPVVLAMYEEVKRELQVLDPLDLLLKLRGLLRDNLPARSRLQAQFDHIFVDEIQDTDPLQSEILAFLCERGAQATEWSRVELRPGKLTIVGDPKQSIYRFRRADLATYASFREHLVGQGALSATLSTNFRSAPALLGWLNDRFDSFLGAAADGEPSFDADAGTVRNGRLASGRVEVPEPRVHVLAHDTHQKDADEARAVEGKALARYLLWLVGASQIRVTDPVSGAQRPVRYGDIAVLAVSTRSLRFLLPQLDQLSIPYAVRGGRLFLEDPVHQRYLSAAKGIADRGDGGGEAASLMAPFFAIDPAAVAWASADVEDPRAAEVVEAREVVRNLRSGLMSRPTGSSFRELVESTGFGRVVARGPNSEQRLRRLGELIVRAEVHAQDCGLDFDGAASSAKAWAEHPFELNPPYPLGDEALQVMTVHQAKGLEFPVVVLWDGRLQKSAFLPPCALRTADDGGWSIRCKELKADSLGGGDLTKRERDLLTAERLRVMYVAATRARDLLVVPKSECEPGGAAKVMDSFLGPEAGGERVLVLERFRDDARPAWAAFRPEAAPAVGGDAWEEPLEARWNAQSERVSARNTVPAGVAEFTSSMADVVDLGPRRSSSDSRFGPVFGQTVHRAIERVVMGRAQSAEAAVAAEAVVTGLAEHLSEAAADVRRTVDALADEGLLPADDVSAAFEVPLTKVNGDSLLSGYADLVVRRTGELVVVDFKSDAVGDAAEAASYPPYVAQVRGYREAIGLVAGMTTIKTALLFTQTGRLAWV